MLNPNWKHVFDKNDLNEWSKLNSYDSISFPFQHQILHKLLSKYFRTENGNRLNPETARSSGQLINILRKTMEQLRGAIAMDEERHAREWEEQKLKDMDPEDIRIMEDELRRDSSMKISSRQVDENKRVLELMKENFALMGVDPRTQEEVERDERASEKLHKKMRDLGFESAGSVKNAANIMIDPNGKQEYKPNDAYVDSELKKGIKVEKEHSNPNISSRDNEEIATEVAKDHLEEDEHYYTKLEKVHED